MDGNSTQLGEGVMARQIHEPHLRRRLKYLRGLEINEVSSVDRGAAIGARVLLMKSDNPKETPMSLQETIGKSFDLRRTGKINKFDLARMHQRRADELGVPLHKYYETTEGRQARDEAISAENFERTLKTSNGDGHAQAAEKRRNDEAKEPVALGEHQIHDDGGDDRDAAAELEKFVGGLMAAHKIDKSRAYDAALKTRRVNA
jgi:hypothetical protein